MSPHQNLIRIAPLLGPEFQTLISMLVLEKLDEAYMILFEKKPVSYLPWSHHFQRLVNYYLIHYPPPYEVDLSQVTRWVVDVQQIGLLRNHALLCPIDRLVIVIPLLVMQGKLRIEPGIAIDTGRPFSIERGQSLVLDGDGKLLAIFISFYEAIYPRATFGQ